MMSCAMRNIILLATFCSGPFAAVLSNQEADSKCSLVPSECQKLPENHTCFGVRLPYNYTSYSVFTNTTYYWEVQQKLEVV